MSTGMEFVSPENWNVGYRNGEPVEIVNAAGVREMLKNSPLGVEEGKRRLIAAGFPVELLEGEL